MQLQYDAELVEGVVFLEARRLEQTGQRLLVARYQRQRTKLYAIADPDERNEAFYRLHLKWFRDFGFEGKVLTALQEFPLIGQRASTLAVRKATSKKDEGAELFVRPDARNVAVAIRCERFITPHPSAGSGQALDPLPAGGERKVPSPLPKGEGQGEGSLEMFLRHELCHISDMLDETFAYEPDISLPDAPPAEVNLLRERYRIIWDITIDGRLKNANEKAHRLAEFTKTFSHMSAPRRQELFEQIWSGPRPTHPELVALAKTVRAQVRNEPGAACPLCRFPTFQWAIDTDLTAEVVAAIQQHFPAWLPQHGCCARCAELYAVKALEQPATLCV